MSKKQPRCYIDSNVVIDYVARSFSLPIDRNKIEEMDYVEKILSAAKDGSILLLSSDITKLECLHAGNQGVITEDIKRKFRSILDSGEVVRSISVNGFIIENAREMQWSGFPLPGNIDKIHIASAIFSNCEELITFDGFKRAHYKNNCLEDSACIEELCKQYNISVVFPSESCVSQKKYYYDIKEKIKKEKEGKTKDNRLSLFDVVENAN